MLEHIKIYINGRYLSQPNTGIQKYAYALSYELSKLGFEIVFLCPKNYEKLPKFGECVEFGVFNGHLWEQFDLPIFLKKNKINLLLNFGNTAPLLYKKNFITIHDLSIYENAKWFSSLFRCYYRFMIPKLVAKAKYISTVSQFSKHEIEQRFPSAKEKIHIIYNGIFYREEEKPSMNLNFKYILYVGSINPRKNIDTLIKAYKKVKDSELKLLLVGKGNSIYNSNEYESSSHIVMMSDVDDGELQSLYRNAELLVLPSFYEGFGLPILEALHHNCPVICSDIAVFNELFDDYVVYCSPNSVEDFSEQINNLLQNPVLPKGIDKLMLKYNYALGANKLITIIEADL